MPDHPTPHDRPPQARTDTPRPAGGRADGAAATGTGSGEPAAPSAPPSVEMIRRFRRGRWTLSPA